MTTGGAGHLQPWVQQQARRLNSTPDVEDYAHARTKGQLFGATPRRVQQRLLRHEALADAEAEHALGIGRGRSKRGPRGRPCNAASGTSKSGRRAAPVAAATTASCSRRG